MGIKNITKLLKRYNKTGIISKHISDYAGKCVCIDFSNYIYKFAYHIKKHKYHKYYYIEGMFNLITQLRSHNITPIFVFDGEPPKEKYDEINRRTIQKQKREEKIMEIISEISQNIIVNDLPSDVKLDIQINTQNSIQDSTQNDIQNNTQDSTQNDIQDSMQNDIQNDIQDSVQDSIQDSTQNDIQNNIQDSTQIVSNIQSKLDEINKLSSQCLYITQKHIKYCSALFKYLGVPYVYGGKEADDMCGYLCKNGYAHACLSEDTDMLAHGVSKVIRDYNLYTGVLNEYNLYNICNDLCINYTQFLDICILCGTDYCKIKGIGPNRSYSIIKKHDTIENAMTYINDKYSVPDSFDYKTIRNMFTGYDDNVSYYNIISECIANDTVVLKEPIYDKLLRFLELTTSKKYTIDNIKNIMNIL